MKLLEQSDSEVSECVIQDDKDIIEEWKFKTIVTKSGLGSGATTPERKLSLDKPLASSRNKDSQ